MTAPGWYPDGQGNTRYWNGQGWAEDSAPAATEQLPAYAAPPVPVPVGPSGHRVEGRKMPLWQPIAIGVLILLGGVGIGTAAGKSATKTVAGPTTTATATTTATVQSTVTATPTIVKVIATKSVTATITYTPPPPTQFGEGTYVVGTDIQPGNYHTDGASDCYWARLSTLNTSDIIDNNTSSGPQTVQVAASDKAFEVRGTCTFARSG